MLATACHGHPNLKPSENAADGDKESVKDAMKLALGDRSETGSGLLGRLTRTWASHLVTGNVCAISDMRWNRAGCLIPFFANALTMLATFCGEYLTLGILIATCPQLRQR